MASASNVQPDTVDIVCPDFASPGDMIEWTSADGSVSVNVVIPYGVQVGEAFRVTLPTPLQQRTKSARKLLKAVLDRLDESEELDRIVDSQCRLFADYEPGCESSHEWYSIYEGYMAEADAFISRVLTEQDTTAEEVFALAQRHRRRDERIQHMLDRLQTAADFEGFCGMMRERHGILQMLYGPSGRPMGSPSLD